MSSSICEHARRLLHCTETYAPLACSLWRRCRAVIQPVGGDGPFCVGVSPSVEHTMGICRLAWRALYASCGYASFAALERFTLIRGALLFYHANAW